MSIDLSEVALDGDLGNPFCISRTAGQFGAGGWIPNGPPCQIPAFGILQEPDEKLDQVPEGDRVEGALTIICDQPIYETKASKHLVSDQVFYFGNWYRVMNVKPWRLNGYWSAILVRMTGS